MQLLMLVGVEGYDECVGDTNRRPKIGGEPWLTMAPK